MLYASVTAAVAATSCAILLLIVMAKVARLGSTVAGVASRPVPSSDEKLDALKLLLVDLHKAIDQDSRRLARIEEEMIRRGRALDGERDPAPPASPTPPEFMSTPMPAPVAAPEAEQRTVEKPAANAGGQVSADAAELLDQYRELIARPQRQEINRWADTLGGMSIEALEDGSFRPLARDAGGLLILLPVTADHALVLPGGRMVVDFATSYATSLNLRPITKQAFAFETDGSAVLRLDAPAMAERGGETWRLVRPGRISGLAAQ